MTSKPALYESLRSKSIDELAMDYILARTNPEIDPYEPWLMFEMMASRVGTDNAWDRLVQALETIQLVQPDISVADILRGIHQ